MTVKLPVLAYALVAIMSVGRYIGPMIDTTQLLRPTLVAVTLAFCLSSLAAEAGADKYKVTAAEKAACTQDAIRLCMDAYPNEEKLIGCMKENRASLTPTCRVAFDAGIRRRHL